MEVKPQPVKAAAAIAWAALLVVSAPARGADFYGAAAISHYVEYVLPSGGNNSTYISIADLARQNGDATDHQIVTVTEGLIFATAQVHIGNPAGIAVRGACQLLISDGTGPQNGLTFMVDRAAVWYTTDNPAYDLTVPVVGYATKPAGKYNVIVQCEQLAYDGVTTADLNQLIVWRVGSERLPCKNDEGARRCGSEEDSRR